MLTNKGGRALIEFTDKTSAIIVTRAMSDPDLNRLYEMVLDWKTLPTKQKEQAIMSQFAITGERNGPEPGPDY